MIDVLTAAGVAELYFFINYWRCSVGLITRSLISVIFQMFYFLFKVFGLLTERR